MAGIFDGLDPRHLADALQPHDPEDPYYAELGRFITEFANAELNLRYALRVLLGVSAEEAAALFHKLSASECIEAINRLLASRNRADIADRLKDAFAQFQSISEVRNAVVHWRSKLDLEKGFVLTNSHRAHRAEQRLERRLPLDQLKRMSVDLLKVNLHVAWAIKHDEMREEFRSRVVDEVIKEPWLFDRKAAA